MRRRPFLVTVGTALTAPAVSGCLSTASGGPDDGGDGSDDGGDESNGDPTTAADGGRDARFAGDPCPTFTESAARTVCYHSADFAREPVVLRPSAETLDGATIEFELRNEGAESVGLNPYAWRIDRRAEDGWERVAPDGYIEPWTTVGEGERVTWLLSDGPIETSGGDGTPAGGSVESVRIDESLDAGVYAFSVDGIVTGGGYAEATESESEADGDAGGGADEGETRIEWVALFEVPNE